MSGTNSQERISDPWAFVLGGVLAVLVTPHLVEIAAGAQYFFLAAAFGSLVGACDASRAGDDMEAALRAAGGIAIGLIMGATILFSPAVAGIVFGAAVVASRWAWIAPERRSAGWALAGAAVAAGGVWLVPPDIVFPFGGELAEYLPALFWGLCGGLGAMTLEMPGLQSDEAEICEADKPEAHKPEGLPNEVDGTVGGNIRQFPQGQRCNGDA